MAYHQELQEINAEIAETLQSLKEARQNPDCDKDHEFGWLADNHVDYWEYELRRLKVSKRTLLTSRA